MVDTIEICGLDKIKEICKDKGIAPPNIVFIESSKYDFFSKNGTIYIAKDISESKIEILIDAICRM